MAGVEFLFTVDSRKPPWNRWLPMWISRLEWHHAKGQKAKRRAWKRYMRSCGQAGV